MPRLANVGSTGKVISSRIAFAERQPNQARVEHEPVRRGHHLHLDVAAKLTLHRQGGGKATEIRPENQNPLPHDRTPLNTPHRIDRAQPKARVERPDLPRPRGAADAHRRRTHHDRRAPSYRRMIAPSSTWATSRPRPTRRREHRASRDTCRRAHPYPRRLHCSIHPAARDRR